MTVLWIFVSAVLFLLLAALITAFVCFYRIFYSPKRKQTEEYGVPDGEIYEAYRDVMIGWQKKVQTMPCREVSIRSFDGLMLRGKYYEYHKDAPIEILFHGYHGSAFRDLSGGVIRCFSLGHNALIVDHRASGKSDGHVITFGVKEHRDCKQWVEFALHELNPDAKIILTGISMGAATVLMCADETLPENVIGILADCGYTSAKEIIKKVIREMNLPSDFLYPFVKLGARLFGRFDIDEKSPIEAMKKSRLPVIFFHGDDDDFVPHGMSRKNYEACASEKHFVTISGAGHGLAYPADEKTYLSELAYFFSPYLSKNGSKR